MLETLDAGRSGVPRRRARRPGRADPGDPRALALRPARVGTVRRHHPAADLLSDPHRDRAARSARCAEIAALAGRDCAVVEFGSGSSTKTPLLLRGDRARGLCPDRHFAATICATAPRAVDARISAASPVYPVEADFTKRGRPARRDRRAAAARLLPRIDDRQFRAAQRDRPAAPFPRHPRHRGEAADRHGPGQAGRAADRRL